MESMFEILLDHGSLGLFAAFLIWLYTDMQKRMDALVDRFREQLEKSRTDQKNDVEELRKRYDAVIKGYNQERAQVRTNIKERVQKVMQACGVLDTKLTDILIRQESSQASVEDVRSDLNALVEIVKQMQTEQRMRDLAKMAGSGMTNPPSN
jgi:HD-GYP domain-containing protein (c-di-GMP phosphodiesterase class II)